MPTLTEIFSNPLLDASVAARVTRPSKQTVAQPVAGEQEQLETGQPETEQPAMPEPDSGLVAKTGRAALGGLAMLGNALDLPGSSVRDVLAGQNPFDQWLSPLSDKNRTTGRELLRKGGAVGSTNNWGNFAGGIGAEILLDPLTYTTPFGVTKAGFAAAKAGLLKTSKAAVNSAAKKSASKAGKEAPKPLGGMLARMKATPRTLINEADDPVKALDDFYNGGGTDDMLDASVQTLAQFSVPWARLIPGLKKTKLATETIDITANPLKFSDDLPPRTPPPASGPPPITPPPTGPTPPPTSGPPPITPPPAAGPPPITPPPTGSTPPPVGPPPDLSLNRPPSSVQPSSVSPSPSIPPAVPPSIAPSIAPPVDVATPALKTFSADEFRQAIGLDAKNNDDIVSYEANRIVDLIDKESAAPFSVPVAMQYLKQVAATDNINPNDVQQIQKLFSEADPSVAPQPAAAVPMGGKSRAAKKAEKLATPPPITPPPVQPEIPQSGIAPSVLAPPVSATTKAASATKAVKDVLKQAEKDAKREAARKALSEVDQEVAQRQASQSPTSASSVQPSQSPLNRPPSSVLPSPVLLSPDLPPTNTALGILARSSEPLTSKEVATALKIKKIDASKQLTELNEAGQVAVAQDGKWKYVGATGAKAAKAAPSPSPAAAVDVAQSSPNRPPSSVQPSPVTPSSVIPVSPSPFALAFTKANKLDIQATDIAFDAVSPKHAELNVQLKNLRDQGAIDAGDAAFLQTVMADSSLEHLPAFTAIKMTKKLLRESKNLAARQPVVMPEGIAGRFSDDSLEMLINPGVPASVSNTKAHTVLHEIGHITLYGLEKSDNALFRAATDAMNALIKPGKTGPSEAAKYFGQITDKADYYTSNQHEMFAQLFADVASSRVKADKLPPTVFALMQEAWEQIVEYIGKVIPALAKNDPRMKTIEKLVNYAGGFVAKSERDSVLKALKEIQSAKKPAKNSASAAPPLDAGSAEDIRFQIVANTSWSDALKGAASKASAATKAWTGSMPKDIATPVAQAIDAGTNVVMAIPGVKEFLALFQRSVAGATASIKSREIGQDMMSNHDKAVYQARFLMEPLVRKIHESGELDPVQLSAKYGLDNNQAIELANKRSFQLDRMLEGVHPGFGDELSSFPELEGAAEKFRRLTDDIHQVENAAGVRTTYLVDDHVDYLRRRRRSPNKSRFYTNPQVGPVIETQAPFQLGRDELLRNIPGGKAVLGEMSIDPKLSGLVGNAPVVWDRFMSGQKLKGQLAEAYGPDATIADIRTYIAGKYGPQLDEEFFNKFEELFSAAGGHALPPGQKGNLIPEGVVSKDLAFDPKTDQRFDRMIKYIASLDTGHINERMPLFGRDALLDTFDRIQNGISISGATLSAQKLIGSSLQKLPQDSQMISAKKIVDDIKIFGAVSLDHIVGHMDPKDIAARNQMLSDGISGLQAGVQKAIARFNSGKMTPEELLEPLAGATIDGQKKSLMLNDQGQVEIVDWVRTWKDPASGAKLVKPQTIERRTAWGGDPQELDDFVRPQTNEKFLEGYGLSPELAKDATRWMKPFSDTEEVGIAREVVNRFSNIFRVSVTAPFPAFHVRNFIDGVTRNIFHKAFDPNERGFMRYGRPVQQAYEMRNGKPLLNIHKQVKGLVDDASQVEYRKKKGMQPDAPLTDADLDDIATRNLAREAFAGAVIGSKLGQAAEVIGDSASSLASQLAGATKKANPMKGEFSPAPAGRTWWDFFYPFAVEGGFGFSMQKPHIREYNADMFVGAHYGRDMSNMVEDIVRLAPFIAFRKQGFNAATAAEKASHIQIDYSKLSQFERRTMRTLFPFYSFSSRILPMTLENLVRNPGGLQANVIRTANRARDPYSTTPDYIAQTAAIPLGKLPTGDQRYVTGLGLAFEDPARFMPAIGGDLPGAMRELGARMNPLFKGPIEYATQHSLFMDGPEGGRPLNDLDPTMGRIRSNVYDLFTGSRTERPKPVGGMLGESFAANSPLGRFLTTARQVTDKRKLATPLTSSLDLLTGVKIADVSPAAQDSILLQRAAKMLKNYGGREMKIPYLPKDAVEGLTPEEVAESKDLQSLLKLIQQRRKIRRQQEEANPDK